MVSAMYQLIAFVSLAVLIAGPHVSGTTCVQELKDSCGEEVKPNPEELAEFPETKAEIDAFCPYPAEMEKRLKKIDCVRRVYRTNSNCKSEPLTVGLDEILERQALHDAFKYLCAHQEAWMSFEHCMHESNKTEEMDRCEFVKRKVLYAEQKKNKTKGLPFNSARMECGKLGFHLKCLEEVHVCSDEEMLIHNMAVWMAVAHPCKFYMHDGYNPNSAHIQRGGAGLAFVLVVLLSQFI